MLCRIFVLQITVEIVSGAYQTKIFFCTNWHCISEHYTMYCLIIGYLCNFNYSDLVRDNQLENCHQTEPDTTSPDLVQVPHENETATDLGNNNEAAATPQKVVSCLEGSRISNLANISFYTDGRHIDLTFNNIFTCSCDKTCSYYIL